MPVRIIGHFGGYRKMFSFGWTCLIYHATTLFCRRNGVLCLVLCALCGEVCWGRVK